MPPKPTISSNEALFDHQRELVGRGRFFPPQLVAPPEGKLFILPPDPGLMRLVKDFTPQSPPMRTELALNGVTYSLLIGWRKFSDMEYISIKTVHCEDWQGKLNLLPDFLNWLNAENQPMLLLDSGGFILHGNPASSTLFPKIAKSTKEELFWSLLNETDAEFLQQSWTQTAIDKLRPSGSLPSEDYSQIFALRSDEGQILGWLVQCRLKHEQSAHLASWGQRLALNYAAEGLLLLDSFGFILYATANCAELMGLGEVDLSGRRLQPLIQGGDKNPLLAQMLGGRKSAAHIIVKIPNERSGETLVQLETTAIPQELKDTVGLVLRVRPAYNLLQQEDREARLTMLDELLGFENGPLIACFSTTDDTLSYISPNCAAWTGITVEQFKLEPRRFWALFPPHALDTNNEFSPSNNRMTTCHTVLERADGRVTPVKVQIVTDPMRHRRDVFVQTLDSLALGEDYAAILGSLASLNQSSQLLDQMRAIASHLVAVTQSERVIITIYDAITGLLINTIAEPEMEENALYGEQIPSDILPQAFETTYLAQSMQQKSINGTLIRRFAITNRTELCGELFLISPATNKPEETDLSPWLNLLGLSIAVWRLQNSLTKEDDLCHILGYGMETIVAQRLQKLTANIMDLASNDETSLGKLNEITDALDKILITIRELQLFASADKTPPASELIDLEQLLGELGVEFIARLSLCGGVLTVEKGLPQVIAPRDYLRLIFSHLIEFTISHSRDLCPLRMNISAHLLPSATRIVFRSANLNISEEECHVLFNPFYRIEKNDQESEFGLALVQKIVETIGGRIAVFIEDTNLTVFSLYLPHRP